MSNPVTQSIQSLLKSSIANDLYKLLSVPKPYKQAAKLTSVIIGLTLEHMEIDQDYNEKLEMFCKRINEEISNNPELYSSIETEELAIYLAFVAIQENNLWLEESLLANKIYRFISLYFYKKIGKSLHKASKFFSNIWQHKKLIKELGIENIDNSLVQIISTNITKKQKKTQDLGPPLKLHLRILNLYQENTIAIGPLIGSIIAGSLGIYTTGILGGLAMSIGGYYLGHIAEKNIQQRNLEQLEKNEKFFLEQSTKKEENTKTPNKSNNIYLGNLAPEIKLDLNQSHAKSKQNTKSIQ